MAKKPKARGKVIGLTPGHRKPHTKKNNTMGLLGIVFACLVVGAAMIVVINSKPSAPKQSAVTPPPPPDLESPAETPPPPAPPLQTNPPPAQPPVVGVPPLLRRPYPEILDRESLPAIEINQAVMVTVELDFGEKIPSIAEALEHIERRSSPADGQGRTFAILDAYGEPTADGKLHISMHVSTEKPGLGALVFRRTDEYLWHSRITPSTNAPPNTNAQQLTILVTDPDDRTYTVDGSSSPVSILDATVDELQLPLRELWTDGEEREMTFIYSACGCPVKVKCRREGDRTVRNSDLPVIFPDDPAVVGVITTLMRW